MAFCFSLFFFTATKALEKPSATSSSEAVTKSTTTSTFSVRKSSLDQEKATISLSSSAARADLTSNVPAAVTSIKCDRSSVLKPLPTLRIVEDGETEAPKPTVALRGRGDTF